MEESTTGNPTPTGTCPKCGYMTFQFLAHFCPTAPKSAMPQTNWKETRKNGELSPEEEKRFYEKALKTILL